MQRIPQELAQTIVDPKAFADGKRIDDCFIKLRREMALAVAEPEGCNPFWVVTRHADILDVERQNDLFHNGDRPTTFTTIEGEKKVREMTGGSPHLIAHPGADGHSRITPQYRHPDPVLVPAAEHARPGGPHPRIARERRWTRWPRWAASATSRAMSRCLYPLRVIMEMIGVPREDEPRMLKLTQELFGAPTRTSTVRARRLPDVNRSDGRAAEERSPTSSSYFKAMTEDRRKSRAKRPGQRDRQRPDRRPADSAISRRWATTSSLPPPATTRRRHPPPARMWASGAELRNSSPS